MLEYLASINDTSFGRQTRVKRARMIQSLPVETIARWLRGERYDMGVVRQRHVFDVLQSNRTRHILTSHHLSSPTTADREKFELQVDKARGSANASLKYHKSKLAYKQEVESKTATQTKEYDDGQWHRFWNANMTKNLNHLG